jgi:hypothetical protein
MREFENLPAAPRFNARIMVDSPSM